jgi:erythrin-vacuolar iron transport family protein
LDIKGLMRTAHEFEKKGYVLYSSVARRTENPLIKEIFEYLANQEEKHIAEIEHYLKKNKFELLGDSAKKTEEFFSTTVKAFKKKLDLCKADMDAYEHGMQLEKDAHKFYKSKISETKNEEVKKFLKFLVEQENAHYILIQNAYEFTKDPKHFFAQSERSFFEG